MKKLMLIICWLLLVLGQISKAQTKGNFRPAIANNVQYTAFDYPKIKHPVHSYIPLNNGNLLLCIGGGVMNLADSNWIYTYPNQFVQSSEYIPYDSSIVLASSYDETVVFEKLKLHQNDSRSFLFKLPKGLYDVETNGVALYIWGLNQHGWNLFHYANEEITTLFASRQFISDVEVFNDNLIFFTTGNSVYLASPNRRAKLFMSLDLPLDGIALSEDGAIYLSTSQGIVKYNSPEDTEPEVITCGVHGKLKIKENYLYVLWNENSQIIKVQI